MNRQEAEVLLQKTFKIPAFYDEQWQTIEKILNGVAASYYGVSNVGDAIHRSKYENGGDLA